MKAAFVFCLLQISITLWGQERIHLYFNSNWEVTTRDKAVYHREAEYDSQNLVLNGKVTDRDMKDHPVMEGIYSFGRRNGEFTFYQKNGKIESKGVYLNSKRSGNWVYYYPDGRLKQSVHYIDDPKKGDFYVSEYFDRKGRQLIKNGTGKWTNDSICIGEPEHSIWVRVTGRFKDNQKTGKWKLTRIADHKLLLSEQYLKGNKMIRLESAGSGTSTVDAPSRTQQRLKDEFHSGTMHKDLIGDASVKNMDAITWRVLGQNSTDSVTPGVLIADGKSHKIVLGPNTKKENYFTAVKSDIGIINKIPDPNIDKLTKTEMLTPGKSEK